MSRFKRSCSLSISTEYKAHKEGDREEKTGPESENHAFFAPLLGELSKAKNKGSGVCMSFNLGAIDTKS